ncbi:MAG: hypothetical protein ACRC5C_08810 [Bacilli bacterium]
MMLRTLVRSHYRAFLGYTLGGAGFVFLITLLFPSLSESIDAKMQMLEAMPPAMLEIFGISESNTLSTVEQLLTTQYYSLMMPIVMLFFALKFANGAYRQDEQNGMLNYWLTSPLPRTRIMDTYGRFYLLVSLVFVGMHWVVSVLGAQLIDAPIEALANWTLIHAAAFGFLLLFGTVALALVASPLSKYTSPILSGMFVTFYLIDLAGRLVPDFDFIRAISPFAYYAPSELLTDTSNAQLSLLLFLGLSLAFYLCAIWQFTRRNLYL